MLFYLSPKKHIVHSAFFITPCLSLWKHYLHSSDEKSGRKKPRKVVMVWLVREAESAERMYADQFEGVVDEKREIVLHGDQRGSSSSLMKEDTIFQYHFFVTRYAKRNLDPLDRDDLENDDGDKERGGGRGRWNYGRLHISGFFRSISNYVSSYSSSSSSRTPRVGVLACGPFPLIHDVHVACTENSTARARFDLQEAFFDL